MANTAWPMPGGQYRMAQCHMAIGHLVYYHTADAARPMPHDQWHMAYDILLRVTWPMPHGQCRMTNAKSTMPHGQCPTAAAR